MNLLEEIDDFIKLKGITHFILRFWLILLKFFSFSRTDGMLASLPDSRIIVCVENSPSCRHENADDDGSTVKRRHYYWSAGGITLRLSFISRRSLAFAASRALLPTSVRREASPMGWLRSACSLLWHQSRTTLCWKIDFIHVLPFSLCLFLSLSFSISLSLYVSTSISLGLSLQSWHNLGQAGTAVIATWSELSRQRSFSAKYFTRETKYVILFAFELSS